MNKSHKLAIKKRVVKVLQDFCQMSLLKKFADQHRRKVVIKKTLGGFRDVTKWLLDLKAT